jgi:hypothetical protein
VLGRRDAVRHSAADLLDEIRPARAWSDGAAPVRRVTAC